MNLRKTIKKIYYLILPLMILISGLGTNPAVQADDNDQIRLEQFDLVTDTSGWVLLNGQLFRTSDSGKTWSDISPSISPDTSVEDVEFNDADMGWVLSSTINPDGSARFQLAQTTDGGNTWVTRALLLFESGEISSFMERAEMGWFDAQTGWISVKQASGSNFSIGTLFMTSDGGDGWERFTLPVADRIVFSDPQNGWAVGGPTDDQVFKTQDGGVTWLDVRPETSNNVQSTVYPPVIADEQGLLVTTSLGLENYLNIYRLETSGNWSLFDQIALDVEPGVIGLAILDPQNLVASVPGTSSIVRTLNGRLDVIENADGLSSSIVELDMISLDVGWAKSVDSNCVTDSSSTDRSATVTCSSTTRLLRTDDGGVTWQNVHLPNLQLGVSSLGISDTDTVTTMSMVSSLDATSIFIGQGFDKCEIPTIPQLQSWWDSSPYKTVNLYIGGSSRACSNNALSASYLEQLGEQGWQFIPTWVGPQAPCTNYISRMSNDPLAAYDQGVAQADLAVDRLAELGLTFPDKTGSVVYYDIEHYGTNTACRDAVNAFMNGWVSQLHVRGNVAGVYGSTLCNTALSDFLTIANVPDAIWPARWYHNIPDGFYDPDATVWNLGSCIPNTVWANHQRIRQYEGSHIETWGGVTFEIDSNVLDGVVASPRNFPVVEDIARADINPINAPAVDFTVTFSTTVSGVDADDFVLATAGVTGASVVSVSGTDDVYTVTVDTGSGSGTIRLDVLDDDSIEDVNGKLLGGTGAGNGNFTLGEAYTMDRNIPLLLSPNHDDVLLTLRPAFDWEDITSASGYNIQVARNDTFTQFAAKANIVNSTYTPIKDLPRNTVLYWRVRSKVGGIYGNWSEVRTFTTPVDPPSIPLLSLPKNKSLTRDYTPTLVWMPVTVAVGIGFDHYQVQVDNDSNFNSPVIDDSSITDILTPTITISLELDPSTAYYWRVRAFNTDDEFNAWSPVYYFRTALPPPVPVSPPEGESQLTLRPTFDWSDVDDAKGYTIQIAKDLAFTQSVLKANPVDSIYTATKDLPKNVTLYWRVQTRGSNGPSDWSEIRSFVTPVSPPTIPVPSFPRNKSLVTDYTPDLIWKASTLAVGFTFDHYHIQLDDNGDFVSPIVDDSSLTDQNITKITLSSALDPNKSYYWRLRAFNTDGEFSGWSKVYQFRTSLLPPVPTAPADGGMVGTLAPAFTWDGVPDAAGYTIQIATDPNFANKVVSAKTGSPAYTLVMDLLPGTLYYWRVNTRGANGPSSWSATFTFMTP